MANGWHEDFEDETYPPELNEGDWNELQDDDGYPHEDEFLEDEFDDEVALLGIVSVFESDDEYPF